MPVDERHAFQWFVKHRKCKSEGEKGQRIKGHESKIIKA